MLFFRKGKQIYRNRFNIGFFDLLKFGSGKVLRTALWIVFSILFVNLAGAENQGTAMKHKIPLNHFYVVVDTATYKDIEQSEFLRKEFAVFEQRTTVRTDKSYTGLYLYGANIYFEFFDSATSQQGKTGSSALAFGTDDAGTIQEIQKKLSWSEPQLITREFKGNQVPWFLMSSPKDFEYSSGMSVWIMEYVPEFLQKWHSQVDDHQSGIERKSILTRYAAYLEQDPSEKMLQDVTALDFYADDNVRKMLTAYCSAFGYKFNTAGNITKLEGPGITIHLAPETPDKRGIHRIEFELKKVANRPQQHKFGKGSILSLEGNKATWIFPLQ